jgi:serine/threonine protein phosphatase PrpC
VQEDALGHWRHHRCAGALFAVLADGLGSHGGGRQAARTAVRAAERLWRQHFVPDTCPAGFLHHWLAEAHGAVRCEAERIGCPARAAVVALVAHQGRAHWAHVGDCRLYLIRRGSILERTRDHSVVQQLFELGHVDEDGMGSHPCQNELWQALGDDSPPQPGLGAASLEPHDLLLLCSDGFWENFRREELERLASAPRGRRHRVLCDAVAEAVRRSGPEADNTTALLVSFDEAPAPRVSPGGLLALTALAACATVAARRPRVG